jgi:dolichol-phosphate mannosyltransferase
VACWGAGRLVRRTPTVVRADRPPADPPPAPDAPTRPAGGEAVSDGSVRT